ncbi:hypothetical protein [Parapedobacter lycopersici]|uniref:hypothetical protein n=1 Tax=Parapedobacter lycopersici TaxID=1864939 RepID=UPI00214DA1AD|nr:hypothetical protein [Parapedobacter lycopersici]
MENLKKVAECLYDLIDFHKERINGYRKALNMLGNGEQCLETLFNAFIKQSENMKVELDNMATHCGIVLHLHSEQFGLAWSVVKAVFDSRMPTYSLDRCKSGENALLIAYHGVEGSEGLDVELRELVKRQKREIIAARDWIAHFENFLLESPKQDQPLAAVS